MSDQQKSEQQKSEQPLSEKQKGGQQDDQIVETKNPPQPPQAPTIERRVKQYAYQWIGVPLLVLIPILALFNVFGSTRDIATDASSSLAISVDYPERLRYKVNDSIEVSVTNLTDRALATLQVQLEQRYVDRFSTVAFTPQVETVTNGAYVIELKDVQPGESRMVVVHIQAEHYWRHAGFIRASADGVAPVSVTVSTIVFP